MQQRKAHERVNVITFTASSRAESAKDRLRQANSGASCVLRFGSGCNPVSFALFPFCSVVRTVGTCFSCRSQRCCVESPTACAVCTWPVFCRFHPPLKGVSAGSSVAYVVSCLFPYPGPIKDRQGLGAPHLAFLAGVFLFRLLSSAL